MARNRFLFVLLLLIFIVSGCSHKMALTKGQSDIDLTGKSIALLSVRIANQHRPDFQLDIEDACNYEVGDPYRSEEKSFNEYLLSFKFDSGTHYISYLRVSYHIPLVINVQGFVWLNLKAEIKPNSVIYLGHIDVVLREKKTDQEVRAGRIMPLATQALVGFSTGTFDVVVKDRFDEDIGLFISEYPALQNVEIIKSILPQWIRPENFNKDLFG